MGWPQATLSRLVGHTATAHIHTHHHIAAVQLSIGTCATGQQDTSQTQLIE